MIIVLSILLIAVSLLLILTTTLYHKILNEHRDFIKELLSINRGLDEAYNTLNGAHEEMKKQFTENMKKALEVNNPGQLELFNVFSYDIFQIMKEKKCLDIFNSVDLYIEMKDGTLKKYNKKTGALE